MLDIRLLREEPDQFEAAMYRRGLTGIATELRALDEVKRRAQTRLQELQTTRNTKSKEIGAIKSKGGDAAALMAEVAAIKEEMTRLEAEAEHDLVSQRLQEIPNILAEDVPDGADESGNVELSRYGMPRSFDFEVKDHVAIGEVLRMMDFEAAAKISGARFVILTGPLARLERALAQFMLDLHTQEHGYTEVNPPLMVQAPALYGTGQLPKFEDQLFKTTNDYYLIPTSEVSLTNIVADAIVTEETLPRRYTALTPCFRSEAGAAGRDTRGMIRQHQFSKVEMVSITRPEDSAEEHERMRGCAEEVLRRLELPYRVMTLCSGDTGFSARKTYDLEVWLPAQNTYREISSCSNCGDFQARRMNARYRPKGQEKGTELLHTLNGSGVAVGRALVAVLENFQQADGSVIVPDVLRPYMAGVDVIRP